MRGGGARHLEGSDLPSHTWLAPPFATSCARREPAAVGVRQVSPDDGTSRGRRGGSVGENRVRS